MCLHLFFSSSKEDRIQTLCVKSEVSQVVESVLKILLCKVLSPQIRIIRRILIPCSMSRAADFDGVRRYLGKESGPKYLILWEEACRCF